MRRTVALLLVVFAGLAAAPSLAAARSPIPVLAYYYIWFNTSSWSRAKSDYPDHQGGRGQEPRLVDASTTPQTPEASSP